MALFSVIIPVYNAERYLRRCLDSLLRQTFSDWEAICVNDGSTDASSGILKSYSARDSRFKIVEKKNSGVSETRNAALPHAEGRYVIYLDSDDFLHPQLMEICNSLISAENPDLIAYTYDRKYRTSTIIKHLFGIKDSPKKSFTEYDAEKTEYAVTEDIFDYVTEYSKPKLPGTDPRWVVKHCQPWRCVYRKKIIEDLRFIPGIIYEDFPWWGEVLLKTKKTVILNLPLYFYYPNKFSYIMSADRSYRIESLKKAIEVSEAHYETNADEKQRKKWHEQFLTPFKAKLNSKLRRQGEI